VHVKNPGTSPHTTNGDITTHLVAVRSAASIRSSSSSIPQGQSTLYDGSSCASSSSSSSSSCSVRLSSESEISSITINPLSLVISLSDDKRASCSSVLNNARVGMSTKSRTSSSVPGSFKYAMGMDSARYPESISSSARIRLPSGSPLTTTPLGVDARLLVGASLSKVSQTYFFTHYAIITYLTTLLGFLDRSVIHERFIHYATGRGTTPQVEEIPGDLNLALPRGRHRDGELFEGLSFVGRKGSTIGPRFQILQ
jgi:hypothetical protein